MFATQLISKMIALDFYSKLPKYCSCISKILLRAYYVRGGVSPLGFTPVFLWSEDDSLYEILLGIKKIKFERLSCNPDSAFLLFHRTHL